MELKKIAFGWLRTALDTIPQGKWILIADGYTDYYDWHAAQGSQKEVESAYLEKGGTIAFTYLVTNGKAKIIRPEQVICSQCNIISSKQGMTGGVCFFCNVESKAGKNKETNNGQENNDNSNRRSYGRVFDNRDEQ